MNKEKIQNSFNNKSFGKILFDEQMKNHTTFKIGGPADVMIIPSNEEELILAIKYIRGDAGINSNLHPIGNSNLSEVEGLPKVASNLFEGFCDRRTVPLSQSIVASNSFEGFPKDYLIMGNGSNLLIKDGGIRGIVIKINDNLNKIEINKNKIYCEAGALLSTISKAALKHNLKNFEFASGIPGTIGGAITMNAGAYGGEMKDVISMVRVLDNQGNIKEYTNKEMNFRYRNSRVWDEKLIVLGAELQLEKGEYSLIEEKMKEFTFNRTSKQPLELPSAGSTFKRPEGYFAGKLIDDSGLRGLRYGGAQVSEKHCGFIVNVDNAKCSDVLHLISVIQKVVEDKFGVKLEMEIKPLGED